MTPFRLLPGAQPAQRRAVIGGLFVASPVTLGLVPVAYARLRRRQPGVDDDELAAAIAVHS